MQKFMKMEINCILFHKDINYENSFALLWKDSEIMSLWRKWNF